MTRGYHYFVFLLVLMLSALFALTKCSPGEEVMATWPIPELPATPAGQALADYLDVFNAGNEDSLRRYIAEHFSPVGPGGSDINARIKSQLRFYNRSHGLNLYKIEDSKETEVTVLAQMRLTQEWWRITFQVEAQPPHLVAGVMLIPVSAPEIEQAAPRTVEGLQQEVDQYLQQLSAADRFSGTVLLAQEDSVLFAKAYGQANKEQQMNNKVDTRYSFASVGKMFTAVAVAQLVQNGKLAYSDPIGKFFPQATPEVRAVTVQQLLTHQSGLPDFFAEPQHFAAVEKQNDPQRSYPPIIAGLPLRFTPGERFEYSNSNYLLLGAIIEKLSGQRYEDYVQQNIFTPTGMTHTTIDNTHLDTTDLAVGYTEMGADGQLEDGSPRHRFGDGKPGRGTAAGGGFTTADDLLRFAQALRENRLLSAAATEQLLTEQVGYERPGYRYAYGFISRQVGDERIVGHSGGYPGVDVQFDVYLRGGFTVIVLANYELVGEPVAMHLQDVLTGME